MKIYIAKEGIKKLEILEHEIIDETPKQYKIDSNGNYLDRINKSLINSVNSTGWAYALSKEMAIKTYKDNIQHKINTYKNWINNLENKLKLSDSLDDNVEMKKTLYLVYANGYLEDYVMVYAATDLEIISEYCKETEQELIDEEEFFETHTVNEIRCIGDKKIKDILFEEI